MQYVAVGVYSVEQCYKLVNVWETLEILKCLKSLSYFYKSNKDKHKYVQRK